MPIWDQGREVSQLTKCSLDLPENRRVSILATKRSMMRTLCIAGRLGTVPEVSGLSVSPSDETTGEYYESLGRTKPYTGAQSSDESYRQHHGGDNPCPVTFDLPHLEFAAGDARTIEQAPHPCQP
jgi:hypothetical protein